MRTSITQCTVYTLALSCSTAVALPPAPSNDSPGAAETIGATLPAIIEGTTVLATDDISVTTLPAPVADVDGPDVFYSFTPAASATYRIQLLPWHRAPLRSSDRRFVVYVQDDVDAFIAGSQAPGTARPVHVDVALSAGTTYRIGVDHNAGTHDNFKFTLILDTLSGANPDDCASVIDLATTVPTAVLNDIDGASADFALANSGNTCTVSGGTPSTAPGIDHVYRFTPATDDLFTFELSASNFDGVLYVNTTCPPTFPAGCLGASDHSTSGSSGGKHELLSAALSSGTDYYIYVDNGSTTNTTGPYALIVDTSAAYEMNEVEPNNGTGSATVIGTPLNGGQLVGPTDVDTWAISGMTGDRVYAWVNNGGTSNSTLDTDLTFLAADGVTVIEFDDQDADGADAPVEDLRFIYATSAPVIAGAQMTSDGTHYLQVTDQSDTGTVHRYRLHTGVEPATRSPLPECEPNDTLPAADRSGKHFYAGIIDIDGDVDVYAIEVALGDRVFAALDGDPERDGTGNTAPADDPRAFHGKLVIYDPAGDILISDVSDSNSIQSAPDYPAQGAFFVARTTGTHYVAVSGQSSTSAGAESTYHLAVFLNDAAPVLTEEVDPLATLTPDYPNDLIDVEATDADSGICSAQLFDDTNVQLAGLGFAPGDPVASFTVELIDPGQSGRGKLVVTDCAGNTFCAVAKIDVDAPDCTGTNFSARTLSSTHGPLFVPDNDSTGIDSVITLDEAGLISDVSVTVTIETIRCPDIDLFLRSPAGTLVELMTDRGSSLEFDFTDTTFDDDAEDIIPILSGDAPFTGTWLPEDPQGFSQLLGEQAQGDWTLNIIDDSNSASGGARLVRWSLDVAAGFASPESFSGSASDIAGFDCGIASIELLSPVNVQLDLPGDFNAGDTVVPYVVSLIDPSLSGSGTVVVTDLAENTCESIVALNGFVDDEAPGNTGAATTDRFYSAEVQVDVPPGVPSGVESIINVTDSFMVGEAEVELTIDTKDVGRLAATVAHDRGFAALLNRTGMDERGSVGLTKDNLWVTLDDDAPATDDAHLEPALGTVPFLGLHQPDGRGAFVGDGITTDRRQNMLLNLANQNAAGAWTMFVGDFRQQVSGNRSTFRRWSMTLKSPCGAEHYVGTATDLAPGSGICTIELAGGATNLQAIAGFTPGAERVDYSVELLDPTLPGSGLLQISDCSGNTTDINIALVERSADTAAPDVDGIVDTEAAQFIGTATDDGPDDTGIAMVELLPYSTNVELVSVTPDPPLGAASVDFVLGLIDPGVNGIAYVRVTDGCGWRGHTLALIDATQPLCSGSVGQTRRYLSTTPPLPIPDNNPSGVNSAIVVADTDIVDDLDITFNITHPFVDDIELELIGPPVLQLIDDLGSTGNDFIDTTLDDDAAEPIPDSSAAAPFTGSWQAQNGPILFALEGGSAAGSYTLRTVDDKANDTGTFESWSLLITSSTFPERYDGRAEDNEPLSSGICSIELVGDEGLVLVIDPAFNPTDHLVRYSVELADPNGTGSGTVRVTDCAGHSCEDSIALGTIDTCTDLADCADLDDNGIRDDGCVWWSCEDRTCLGTDVVFADMGGQFGECPPDGTADGNDRFQALNCFANVDPNGGGDYTCEALPPAALNVDAGGQFGSCLPDGVCDGNDAFAALNAFGGVTTCACPLDGAPAPAGPGTPVVIDRANLSLRVNTPTVRPGDPISVDIYLDSTLQDLRGYQLHVGVSGGEAGQLRLIDIDLSRPHVLAGQQPQRRTLATRGARPFDDEVAPYWSAFNRDTAQLVVGLDTPGVAVTPGYLATFTFRAPKDARGMFVIDLLHGAPFNAHRSFLFATQPHHAIELQSTPVVVEVIPQKRRVR